MSERLIVCGGRDFDAAAWAWDVLDWLAPSLVIHGDCRTGADRIAHEWAVDRGVDVVTVPALWKPHGRAAGPRRNKLMARLGIADAVLAFPGGKGTASMVHEARRAGLKVIDKRGQEAPDAD